MTFDPVTAQAAVPKVVKRVTVPVGSRGTVDQVFAGGLDWCQRIIVALPFKTTRWRLRFCNTNPRTDVAGSCAGTLSMTGMWVGPPDFGVTDTSGRPDLSFAATPVQALGAATLPSGGSEWTSGWVTNSAAQFVQGQQQALSFGFTSGGASLTTFVDNRGCQRASAGASATAGSIDLLGTNFSYVSVFDLLLDCEFVTPRGAAGIRVLAAIGDSITAGYTARAQGGLEGPFQHEAWPDAAALRGGFAVVNMGIPGAYASDFATGTGRRWSRCDLTTTVPDAAVISLGTNDIVLAGSPALSIESSLISIIGHVRTLGIKQAGFGTIMPNNQGAGLTTAETIRVTVNNALRALPWGAQFLWDHDKAIAIASNPAIADIDLMPTPPHPNFAGHQRLATIVRLAGSV